jgi:uncharacterized surface protein with fasciclin (FAS1) repeats
MKINKFSLRKTALAVASFILLGFGTSCADLWSEQHPGTYYTNNGETVADYLTGRVEYHGDYSYFIAILQKAELWGQLRTYGAYTCFAPDDSAIQAYIDMRYAEASDSLKPIFQSLETVLQNRKLCDTIARTHIFANVMYASDLSGNGVLQHPNLLDRYVTYSSAPDSSRKAYDANGNVVNTKSSKNFKLNRGNEEFYTTTKREKNNPQRFTADIVFEGKYYKPALKHEYVDRMRRTQYGEIFLG